MGPYESTVLGLTNFNICASEFLLNGSLLQASNAGP